jgi:hypothetical protein
LEIGIPGNLPGNGTGFVILVDSVPGQGQQILSTANFPSPPSAVPNLDAIEMDAGFAPDVLIYANASGGTLYVDRYTLPTFGNGQKRYIGNSAVGSSEAALNGGNNPNGMMLTLDNSNTAGVNGVSGAGAETATTGLEGLLPMRKRAPSAHRGPLSRRQLTTRRSTTRTVLPRLSPPSKGPPRREVPRPKCSSPVTSSIRWFAPVSKGCPCSTNGWWTRHAAPCRK